MTFRVELSDQAHRDAEDILAWLYGRGAGLAGADWFLGLSEALESLSSMPNRNPLALENDRFPFEVRELRYGRRPHVYRLLFTVEADSVQVLHIRHARRPPLK